MTTFNRERKTSEVDKTPKTFPIQKSTRRYKLTSYKMDVDPEDTVPAGRPRRRGAVTVGGGDEEGEGGGGNRRRMSRRMSTNIKSIWSKMATSGSHRASEFQLYFRERRGGGTS